MVNMLAFLGLPQGAEWILIALVALLIFGRRLPEIARSLGKSITEFKKGVKESETEFHKAMEDADKTADQDLSKEQEKPKTSDD